MFDSGMFRSVAFKFLYGAVAAVLAALLDIIQTNPDPVTLTMAAVKVGLLTALVAFVKKFVAGLLIQS